MPKESVSPLILPSGRLIPRTAASVSNPPAGQVAYFIDSATGHLSQKDSTGAVIDLVNGNGTLNDGAGNAFLVGNAPHGSATSLAARLNAMTALLFPPSPSFIAGRYYDNAYFATGALARAGVANRVELCPFISSKSFSIDTIGVAVNVAAAGSLARILIYDSDAQGYPNNLLYTSPDLDCSTVAFVSSTISFTFSNSQFYWLGVWTSSTQQIFGYTSSISVPLGLTANNAATYANGVRRTIAFASSAPSTWGFVQSDLANLNSVYSVRFKVV